LRQERNHKDRLKVLLEDKSVSVPGFLMVFHDEFALGLATPTTFDYLEVIS